MFNYQKELDYWKEATENGKKTDIDEIISYLKSQYSGNKNQIVFIQCYRGGHSLEEMFKELKAMSKYVQESENMSLKSNTLFGKWLSNAGRRYKYILKRKIHLNDLTNGYIKSVE